MPRPVQWFTTTQFTSPARHAHDEEPGPHSVAHAKTMGTSFTACGQDASTWFKSWETPFLHARGHRCPSCIARTEGTSTLPSAASPAAAPAEEASRRRPGC